MRTAEAAPCPRHTEALLQPDPAVPPKTVQQYFQGTDSRDFFDSRWAVSELLRYEEAPLVAAPGTKRAYRVQALGDFGWVIRLENDGAEAHFSFKHRPFCEDRYGLGAVRTRHGGSISIDEWQRVGECMSSSFWNAPTHSQPPAEDAQTIMVEGIRGGRHHVIWRQILHSSGMTPADALLAGCIDHLKEAAGWVRHGDSFIVP